MKRALALMLMLCVLLPQTAQAAVTYYVEVTVSDETGRSVSGESSHYASRQEPLAAAVVGIIAEKYEELETVFAKTGLRGIVDQGIDAFYGGDEAWAKYVDQYNDDVQGSFKDTLKDVKSTYQALTVDRENRLTYVDEGVTYTVTVTLRQWGRKEDKHDVTIKAQESGEGGQVTSSHKKAEEKDDVVITVVPKEGYIVNRVTAVSEKGERVRVMFTAENVYTFVMPDGDVEVAVTYIKAPTDPEKTGVARRLVTDERIAYLQGLNDGLFHGEKSITRAEVAMVFYRLLRTVEPTEAAPFADVPAGAWYAEAVNTLASLGIVKGMSDTEFAPNAPITRAQFVAICARFADTQVSGHTFADVSGDHWAKDYISTAAAFGWVNGVSDTEFAPDRSITRAEAAAIVNRVLARSADRGYIDSLTELRYEDVQSAHWAWYDINEASMGKLPR